jgi:hypothetical protein
MNWNKRRFEWKKLINQSRAVPRSAKHMASHLCDCCVNRNTGQFFHSNDTLAAAMGVSTRSVQRSLKTLSSLGWLRKVKVRGKRRTYQLTFPNDIDNAAVGKHDNFDGPAKPRMAHEHASSVAPIYNQVINNNGPKTQRLESTIFVSDREQGSIASWIAWISENTEYDGKNVMALLRKSGGFHLPSRFPRNGETDLNFQKTYFESLFAAGAE